ncbi:MAG: CBS domain-containing protein [Brockia lithotrophica]|nr:CBS domain-containing protein [Brockia lithotrophica]
MPVPGRRALLATGGRALSLLTKHEQILAYIESLPVGEKISVRSVARALGVSEGTAYRAIKEAESQGLVSTIERVGTIRIERKKRETLEQLTFGEVAAIVDGEVLAGASGLGKRLNKFVIGAMRLDDMMKYVEPGNLLIVGNRDEAHRLALLQGAAVLITGGFDADPATKKLADEVGLPLISSPYDTFTVATLINRAIYDQLIKKKILRVEDIYIPLEKTVYVTGRQTVGNVKRIAQETGHHHFPVVDEDMTVIGVVSARDLLSLRDETPVADILKPLSVYARPQFTVAATAHTLVWEDMHLLPVVDADRRLVGIVTRKDILKALQQLDKQPHVGDTFEDLIFTTLKPRDEEGCSTFVGSVTPQMTNRYGMLSSGVLASLIYEAAIACLRRERRGDFEIEHSLVYFLRPVPIEQEIEVEPRILDIGRRRGRVEVTVRSQGQEVAKALIAAQVWEG